MSRFNWRRTFQFSLRIIFLAFTLSAAGAFVIALPIRDYYINNEIEERLSLAGARVTREPIVRGWFLYFFPKFALRIVRVDFVNTHVGENELTQLTQLKELHTLYLFYTDVNDTTLSHISQCRQLRTLDLDGTQVSDACLIEVSQLPRLEWLGLRHTKISDAGLEHLYSQHSLETVVLWETHVTENGIKELRAALPGVSASRVPFEITYWLPNKASVIPFRYE